MHTSTLTNRANPQHREGPAVGAGIAEHCSELRRRGVRVYLLATDESAATATAGGVPLRISVSGLVQSSVPKDSLVMRLAMLLEQGIPVTLSLCNLGVGDAALRNFEKFCECLSYRLPEQERHSELIGLCIRSQQIPLQAYLVISTSLLGNGPRYVNLDYYEAGGPPPRCAQEERNNTWAFLWRQSQSDLPLLPSYGESTRSPCALLADEPAGSVLPAFGLRVPPDSAWLPMEICLTDFSDGKGRVDVTALQGAALACVDIGERILDQLFWPLPRHDWDAVNNRRLAVNITGIGDLVLQRAADPQDWRTLQWLDRILAGLRASLWKRSREIAQEGGVLPAIQLDDPSTGWTSDEYSSAWQTRWRQALEEHAVRHRNILVLSPYSVLPCCADANANFTDLLPLLVHADAIAFANPPDFSAWNVNEFSGFHRRALAIIGAAKT